MLSMHTNAIGAYVSPIINQLRTIYIMLKPLGKKTKRNGNCTKYVSISALHTCSFAQQNQNDPANAFQETSIQFFTTDQYKSMSY